MTDELGCFVAVVLAVALLALCAAGVHSDGRDSGRRAAHAEFLECRALYTTADSATVSRTKPECRKWTIAPRDAAKGEG